MTLTTYDEAHDTITRSIRSLAERKNVPLDPKGCEAFATAILERLRPGDIRGLARAKPKAFALSFGMIDRALDKLALTRLAYLAAKADGDEVPSLDLAIDHARAMVNQWAANRPKDEILIWPDLADVMRLYGSRISLERVNVTMPQSARVHASYRFKPWRQR
jgi:hypothetical protein